MTRLTARAPGRALRLPVAVLLALVLAACSTAGSEGNGGGPGGAEATRLAVLDEKPTPDLPVTVPSWTGTGKQTDVEVTDVSRILPLSPGLAEIVFMLGLGDNAVGRDNATTFAEAADLPVVTRSHEVSAEGVLSLRPSVVLAASDTGPREVLDQIRKAGVPVVVFEQTYSLEEVDDRIRAVARALGVPDAGEELVRRTALDIASVPQVPLIDGRKPKVAFLYVRGSVSLALLGGDGSGADDLIEAVGAEDVGASRGLAAFTALTPEEMIRAAPDVILVMTKGMESVGGLDGVIGLAGVAQTPAGKDRRVVAIEDGQLLSFGPRTAQTVRLLSEKLTAELS